MTDVLWPFSGLTRVVACYYAWFGMLSVFQLFLVTPTFLLLSHLEVLEPSKKRPAETTPAEDKKARKIQGRNLERKHKHRIQTWNEPSLMLPLNVASLKLRGGVKFSCWGFEAQEKKVILTTSSATCHVDLFRIRQASRSFDLGFVLHNFCYEKQHLCFAEMGQIRKTWASKRDLDSAHAIVWKSCVHSSKSHAGTPMKSRYCTE